ncbi:MAG: flagellar hook-basal body complex protein [Gammaproteobacteria bacterium]|nr:MAG: flagellar hook-basal body complex protein [Gammaproteobacteria bacterium]
MPTNLNQLWMVAGSGIFSQQRHIDMISHNVANANTVGFKASQAGFQSVIREVALSRQDANLFEQAQPGDTIQEGLGTVLTQTTHRFVQGPLERTNQPFNLAINGDGFFQITDREGRVLYTRAGDFQRDAQGRLVNSEGFFLNPQIEIPENVVETYIDSEGRVLGLMADPEEPPQELGVIQLASFANPDGLLNVGHNSFEATLASGPAQLGQPGTEGRGLLLNGFLERSNVDLGQEMVSMLRTQKAYSLSLRALGVADQIFKLANEMPSA